MSMAQEIDYSTLKWVKDEIDESLKQTRQALESYVENPEDKTQVRFCATYLHQIYGTLQMVEIYGGALLAEEMESLCNAILLEKIAQKDEAYDVLMRAILQLPSYLEHIERGEPDQPVILLPLLNDLRSVRGDHLLSDNAFFAPNLTVNPPAESVKEQKSPIDIKQYAKKLRTVYQASLVGVYRDSNTKGNLKKIGAVCRELMNLSDNENGKRLWWVATGLIEALLDKGVDMSNAVKQVVGQLDKHIKQIIESGEQAFAETPTELLKNILYYVATANSKGKRVNQIKKAFKLDELLPNSTNIDEAYDSLRGSTQDLMKTVSAVIKEDLLHVKDQLDIFVRSGDRSAEQLKPLEEQLRRIADTLAMLGLGDLRKIIQDQVNNIEHMQAGGESPNDIALMEIASSLLYIESSLEGVEAAKFSVEESESETILPAAEQKQLNRLVIKESAEVLAKVKESFNTFANDPAQINTIANTPEYLEQVRGVLAMLTFNRAATLLQSATGYIADEIVQKQNQPNQAALDAIADVITSIEYYLEAVTEKRLNPESLLSVAEQSLTKLGYSITEKEEASAATVKPFAAAEPLVTEFQTPTSNPPAAPQPFDLREDIVPLETQTELPRTEEIETIEFTLPQESEDTGTTPVVNLSSPPMEAIDADLTSIDMPPEATSAEPESQAETEPAAVELSGKAQTPAVDVTPETPTDTHLIASVDQQLVDDVDEEILEIFIEEADEVLVVMRENLTAWQNNAGDKDALTILRRSYHTIKGSGRLAGATVIGEFAWAIENMLNRVIDGKINATPQVFAVLEQAQLGFENLIKQLKGEVATAPHPQPIVEVADALANGETVTRNIEALASTDEVAQAEPGIDQIQEAEKTPSEVQELEFKEHEFQKHELALEHTQAEETSLENFEVVEVPTQEATLGQIFKKETSAHLAAINQFLDEYDQQATRLVSEPLMRALHTLHGSARMAEATAIAALSEGLDRYFRTLHDSEQNISDAAITLLRQSVQAIEAMSNRSTDNDYQPENLQQLLDDTAALHKIAKAAHAVKETGTFSLHDEKADAELVSIFMEEAADILGHMDDTINRWRGAIDDLGIVDEVQRALHTLKGGARMANVKPVADLTHHLESALEQVAEGKRVPDLALLELTQQCYDRLEQVLDFMHMGQGVTTPHELIEKLQQYTAEPPAAAIAMEQDVDELPLTEHETETIELSSLLLEPDTETIHLADSELEELGLEEPGLEEPGLKEPEFVEQPTEKIAVSELDQELVSIFLDEADELQENLQHTLDGWPRQLDNINTVAELQRNLHTLKGGARMAGLNPIADVSHAMETVLEHISERRLAANGSHPQLVQQCLDWLNQTIQAVRNRQPLTAATELLAALEQVAAGGLVDINTVPMPTIEGSAQAHLEEHVEEIAFNDVATDVDNIEEISLTEDQSPETHTITPEEISPASETEVHEEPLEEPLEVAPQFSVPSFSQASLQKPAQAATREDYDEELVGIFLEEADEIQVHSEQTIQQWDADVDNRTFIAELQRALHTLKGGARMAGIKAIGDLSHSIESLLEAVTEGNMQPTAEFPKVVQACHDWLSNAIEQVKHKQDIQPAGHLLQQLENLLAGKPAKHGLDETPPVNATPQVEMPMEAAVPAEEGITEREPGPQTGELIQLPVGEHAIPKEIAERLGKTTPRVVDEQVRVRAELIDNLVNYASEANIYNARIEQQLNAWGFNLMELKQTVYRLHEQLRKFEIETEAQIMYRHTEVSTADDQFDPLELDRFSYMQQLSRGMVESLGDLTSIENLLESILSDADVLLLQQSRVNNDLQEGLMRTRMTPFSSVLPRLRRIVRQTCEETGKEAGLNVVGAEGEMDRTQLNRIVPALEHILRNAVDHGLEDPETRKQAGKTPEGHIEIRFSREGSEVVLRINDDGAGINIGALRQKAVERGLITQDTKISDNELTEFILQSGFSTAKAVTQISGRGVGMDVVNTEIKQLNGSLHIETKQGQGSTFIVRLPLTVVVNQALMVKINEATYAIQMTNIEHVVRARGDMLTQLVTGEMEHYDYAGFQYDALNLSQLLHGQKPAPLDPKATYPLLLGRSGDHRVAMQVEELLGRQEIVIKSLGPQLSAVNNISGATILPDGEVALILDLGTLIRSNMALQQTAMAGQVAIEQPAVQRAEEKRPLVMIVDDSITVRKVTQRLLDRHNFDTLTAKDGVDALTLLLEQIPDIMLLDIEMPRMDGFELATAIRNDDRMKNIPIIMITSRTGEKHRDRAMNIGVNMYLGKPYQEQELLENIQTLLKTR